MKARCGDDGIQRPYAVSDHILSEHLGIVILSEPEPFARDTLPDRLLPPGSPLANAEVV